MESGKLVRYRRFSVDDALRSLWSVFGRLFPSSQRQPLMCSSLAGINSVFIVSNTRRRRGSVAKYRKDTKDAQLAQDSFGARPSGGVQ